mmetsp:Transcript_4017/g.13992  ORF Transcript_4017/g.13992 Transcript_4017/m.13992 type:complete len:222 (-) Transcript_4017:471-1136(-)
MFSPSTGENPPEVTSPTSAPSTSRILLPPRAGAPLPTFKPTRRLSTPSASCFLMTSPPTKSHASLRDFPIVHVNPASIGPMLSFRSLPYRHKPASRRSESRAPRPQSRAAGFSSSFFASATVSVFKSEISNPSSPVYPVLVSHTGLPSTVASVNIPKYSLSRSKPGHRGWSTSTALGPWNASSDRSEWTMNSTSMPFALASARCALICAWSLAEHAPFNTM